MSQINSGMGGRDDGRHAFACRPFGLPADESRHAVMKKIVVIGGGLAGLSAGYHLAGIRPDRLRKRGFDRRPLPLVHPGWFYIRLHGASDPPEEPLYKELVARLLPDAFNSHERLAAIYSKSTTTPYPFQANTYGLPPEVVKECVVGFVETLQAHANGGPKNFHDWILQTFGAGIAKHFMLPYNEKFWKQDLRTITSDWVSWSIPKPTLEEVVNGALGLTNKGMGYNPQVIYPKNGGIECLPQALARSDEASSPERNGRMIDPKRKVVRLVSGREEPYDSWSPRCRCR